MLIKWAQDYAREPAPFVADIPGSATRTKRAPKSAPTVLSDGARRQVMRSIEDGAFTLAARQLLSKGVHDVITAPVEATLRGLHPLETGVTPIPHPEGGWKPPSLYDEPAGSAARMAAIMDAISGFKAGSAPGISGLRPHHLQQLTPAGNPHTTELLMQLDIFVQVCLEGKLAMTMAHVLGAASLVAMKKVKLSDVTDEMDEVQALQAL